MSEDYRTDKLAAFSIFMLSYLILLVIGIVWLARGCSKDETKHHETNNEKETRNG